MTDRRLEINPSAEREFEKLDYSVAVKLKDIINKRILKNPEAGKPLRHNLFGLYKWTPGDWRIIYSYDSEKITIVSVGNRNKIYGGH